jgi:hypothetical protein
LSTENNVVVESVAPWAGYDGYEKEMKSAIMEISKVYIEERKEGHENKQNNIGSTQFLNFTTRRYPFSIRH